MKEHVQRLIHEEMSSMPRENYLERIPGLFSEEQLEEIAQRAQKVSGRSVLILFV